MDKLPRLRKIDVLLFEGVNILDVAGPVQAFEAARVNGSPAYRPRFVSIDGSDVKASCGLKLGVDGKLSMDSVADDLMLPGGNVDPFIANPDVCEILQLFAAKTGDGRLISICSGALFLAHARVLDGLPATTHWSRLEHTRRYPDVLWDLDRISTEQGRIFTSAGVTTGIDLALAIIRKDCGNEVALGVARELVMQLRRSGGQSQYAMHLAGQFTDEDRLTQLIERVVALPQKAWPLETLAHEARMNARTLTRRFKRHLNITPTQFVERTRVDHARGLLSANISLKQTASDSGFGDLQRMRRAFQRHLGTDVTSYVSLFIVKDQPRG